MGSSMSLKDIPNEREKQVYRRGDDNERRAREGRPAIHPARTKWRSFVLRGDDNGRRAREGRPAIHPARTKWHSFVLRAREGTSVRRVEQSGDSGCVMDGDGGMVGGHLVSAGRWAGSVAGTHIINFLKPLEVLNRRFKVFLERGR